MSKVTVVYSSPWWCNYYMRTIFLILLALIFTLSSFTNYAPPISAQIPAVSQDPYTEYLKNVNQYFTARRAFESSRARYNSFKTLQAKQTVTADAKNMLQTGRAALTQYTYYVAQTLERAANVNERAKYEILADLQTHNGYLASIENVLSETPTFSDINTHSLALNTRYGYVRVSAEQALLYMDAVRLNDQITRQKTVIEEIENITRTLPDSLREKALAQTWIDEARLENSKDEEAILTLIDNIYPQPSVGNTRRAYEEGGIGVISSAQVTQISTRVINRAAKAQETFTILSEGYRKL